jgi:enoyl-CoA hydratase/carnithine racemase
MTEAAPLIVERDARGVYRLTMNRPDNFNALSMAMLEALLAALRQVAADPQARLLVLGAVGKAFCPGHNLKEMIAHPELAFYQKLFGISNQFMLGLQKLEVPVIARVQGLATAAGCQLVAQCDLAVASTEARFATSGIKLGLFCATPSVPLLRNMPAKQAMQMLLTGEFISAAQAVEQGLINRAVPPEALDAAVEELVASILAKPRHAVAVGKALFYQQREIGVEAAYQLASQTMAVNMMDEAAQEGVLAFTEKRAPSWRGDPS